MIIAHLPAGYLLAQSLEKGFGRDRVMWGAVLVGSVIPDLDMLRFLFVDHGAVHHHSYITHNPFFWLGFLLFSFFKHRRLFSGLAFGGLLHMLLDTFTGPIRWGDGAFSLTGPMIEVPATQSHWVLSFIFYWTFLVELAIVALAVLVYWRSR